MSRAVIIINTAADRQRAASWAMKAPWGTRIEYKHAKRTVEQNSRLWAMLTDVATQATHAGKKLTPDTWKILFMHAVGQEVQFLPSLDGASFIPLGYRSSDLSKGEMSDLMEFITAWCAENGVTLHDGEAVAA